MLVGQLLRVVDRLAPAGLAEDWDNVGLLVGRHNQPARRVLVALDLRADVLAEAADGGCDAVLVHHPPIFPSLSAVSDDRPVDELVLRAAESRTAILAAHTNLDAAPGGLNDMMAELLAVPSPRPLAERADAAPGGLGRIGEVEPTTVGELAARAGRVFGAQVVHCGDSWGPVRVLACCTGSGAGLIDAARAAGADAYVTSDLKYHDADRARGLPLVGLPHAAVERRALREWSRLLARSVAEEGGEVAFAETSTDPWQTA